jgi:hypothetical protein
MFLRREFLQRLSVGLHGTLGSCLRDALYEGCANVVSYPLFVPWAQACGGFPLLFHIFLILVVSTAFSTRNNLNESTCKQRNNSFFAGVSKVLMNMTLFFGFFCNFFGAPGPGRGGIWDVNDSTLLHKRSVGNDRSVVYIYRRAVAMDTGCTRTLVSTAFFTLPVYFTLYC